jgi:hypothetical protein
VHGVAAGGTDRICRRSRDRITFATLHPQCVNHDCTCRCDCGEEADYLMRGATRPSLARCRAHTNPHAFDLLELGGKDLRRTPLEERKRALANWFAKLPGRCN